MSDTEDLQPPKKKKDPAPHIPGQPLPRLWKTEPEEGEEEDEELLDENGQPRKRKKKPKDPDQIAATPASKSSSATTSRSSDKSSSRSSGRSKDPAKKADRSKPSKKKPPIGENGEKRVLVEETPTLDTYESRQRARLILGGLMAFCFVVIGWTVFRMIVPGSGEIAVGGAEMPSPDMMATNLGSPPSREPEANYMLERAKDYARRGKVKDAVGMLKRVVSVYTGTQAAAEARAALDRPAQNLPLFPDRPYVVAQRKPAESNPAPRAVLVDSSPAGAPPSARPANPPPARIQATATGGIAPPPSVGQAAGPPPMRQYATTAGSMPAPVPPGTSLNPATVGPASPPLTAGVAANAPLPPAPGQPGSMMTGANAPPPSATAARSQPQPQPTVRPGEVAIVAPTGAGAGNAMITAPPPGADHGAADRNPPAASGIAARMLPIGFRPRLEAGLHESGWPRVIVGERDGGTMVLVPGATFVMGVDGGEAQNGPAHHVRVSTFYIDRYEVTNRQFRTFIEDCRRRGQPAPSWLTEEKLRALPDGGPAVNVTYRDAETYSIWALKRLATEAQWELAARSVDGRRHPWGDQPPRWSRERKYRQIDLVGSFPEDVSPYGVFDMAGNAVEWVRDWYDPRYFDKLRDKTVEDPTGPPVKRQGIQRSVRGGSSQWLVYDRQGVDTDRRLPYLGFRCTLAVEGGEASAGIVPHTEKPDASKNAPAAPANPSGGALPF